jgi:hypothetical protein
MFREVGTAKLGIAGVDRNGQPAVPGVVPCIQRLHRLLPDAGAEFLHAPSMFHRLEKTVRCQQPVYRMRPARQRLEARDLPGARVDLRLEPRVDGVGGQRVRNVLGQVRFRMGTACAAGHMRPDGTQAGELRLPQRMCGAGQGRFGIPPGRSAKSRVSDRRRQPERRVTDPEGCGEPRAHPVGDGIPDAQARRGDRMQNDAERCPAQVGDQIVAAQRRAQAPVAFAKHVPRGFRAETPLHLRPVVDFKDETRGFHALHACDAVEHGKECRPVCRSRGSGREAHGGDAVGPGPAPEILKDEERGKNHGSGKDEARPARRLSAEHQNGKQRQNLDAFEKPSRQVLPTFQRLPCRPAHCPDLAVPSTPPSDTTSPARGLGDVLGAKG